jgi:hypothetical protein
MIFSMQLVKMVEGFTQSDNFPSEVFEVALSPAHGAHVTNNLCAYLKHRK